MNGFRDTAVLWNFDFVIDYVPFMRCIRDTAVLVMLDESVMMVAL